MLTKLFSKFHGKLFGQPPGGVEITKIWQFNWTIEDLDHPNSRVREAARDYFEMQTNFVYEVYERKFTWNIEDLIHPNRFIREAAQEYFKSKEKTE